MPTQWTSSTLVFVRDVETSIGFYVDELGFTLNMRYEEEARAKVAGVSRGDGCALLLTSQWPDKVGTAVLYTALDAAEFATLRADLEAKGTALEEGFWGKPLMVVEDPDGNQLYFPLP
jgi:catechol 2,3-dioxygenase-like lactoylglutathione lyase family enzyme